MNAGYQHLLSLAPKLHIATGSLAQCLPTAQVVSACRAMPQLDETLIFPDLLCSTYVPTRLPHGNSIQSPKAESITFKESLFSFVLWTHLSECQGRTHEGLYSATPGNDVWSTPTNFSAQCQWWDNCPTKCRKNQNMTRTFNACQWNEENVTLLVGFWYCRQLILCHYLAVTEQTEGWLD